MKVARKTPLPHVQPSDRGGTGSEALRGTPSVELGGEPRESGPVEKLAHPSELPTCVNARTAVGSPVSEPTRAGLDRADPVRLRTGIRPPWDSRSELVALRTTLG